MAPIRCQTIIWTSAGIAQAMDERQHAPLYYVIWSRDHSGYGLCQWETTLLCNVVSHWLCPERSLSSTSTICMPTNPCDPGGTAWPRSRMSGTSFWSWTKILSPAPSLGPLIYSYCSMFSFKRKPRSAPVRKYLVNFVNLVYSVQPCNGSESDW